LLTVIKGELRFAKSDDMGRVSAFFLADSPMTISKKDFAASCSDRETQERGADRKNPRNKQRQG
jgi:hypothetical protein